jgi:hypothetical protein
MANVDFYYHLARLGSCYEFDFQIDLKKILDTLPNYQKDWQIYNPRKEIKRYGLSLTSLDGSMSGVPDLDSLLEFNQINNTDWNEMSFKTQTPLYKDCFDGVFGKVEPHIGRSHIIKLAPGGYFPIHRDGRLDFLNSFRLFIPILNCNPPKMYFILDEKILKFNHGRAYFIDTCKEHLLFNSSNSDSIFAVFNISLSSLRELTGVLAVN